MDEPISAEEAAEDAAVRLRASQIGLYLIRSGIPITKGIEPLLLCAASGVAAMILCGNNKEQMKQAALEVFGGYIDAVLEMVTVVVQREKGMMN